MSIRFLIPDLRRIEKDEESNFLTFKFADHEPLRGLSSIIDWRLGGHLTRLLVDDFLSGAADEVLLMPLGPKLPQEQLIICGLGSRDKLDEARFKDALNKGFDTLAGLKTEGAMVSLPGRAEGLIDGPTAMEWFMNVYESRGGSQSIAIVEPLANQSAMLPAVERWRLRQVLPT